MPVWRKSNNPELRSAVQSKVWRFREFRLGANSHKSPWIDEAIEQAGRGMMSSPLLQDDRPLDNTHTADHPRKLENPAIRSSKQPERRHEVFQPKYHYTPLGGRPDEIRTMRLLPGQGDDPIRIQMEPSWLDCPPSYEAISYVWGNKDETDDIAVCEGEAEHSLGIPRSLYGALRQLRQLIEPRTIWVDAICMNQEDDREKSHQVQLMRRIYQGAARVVIWLGDNLDLDSQAGSLLELIGRINRREFEAVPPPSDWKTWSPFRDLFRHPWFRRVWCLQEAVMAPTAEVMLGEHSVPWQHVGFAASWMRSMPTELIIGDHMLITGIYHACLIYSLSHWSEEQQRVSFLQLLTLTRAFEATDYRDKVYGILGIPTKESNPDAGVTLLRPDYTKTLAEVYIDCALAVIRSTRTPRILSYVQHEQFRDMDQERFSRSEDATLHRVPSWVPRWHQYFARTLAPSDQQAKNFRASASLNLDPVANIGVRGLELITHGARVSRLKMASQLYYSSAAGERAYPLADTANGVWMTIFLSLRESTPDPTALLYTLSALLTAGKDWHGSLIEDRDQHLSDFLACMYESRTAFDRGSLKQFIFRPRTDIALPPGNKMGQAHRFQAAMRSACTWRRFIATDDGHVGLGPQVAQWGDVVCILNGADVPLLLRPEADGGSFRLVGEAYVQGMMLGELNISQVEQIVLSDKAFVD